MGVAVLVVILVMMAVGVGVGMGLGRGGEFLGKSGLGSMPRRGRTTIFGGEVGVVGSA